VLIGVKMYVVLILIAFHKIVVKLQLLEFSCHQVQFIFELVNLIVKLLFVCS
jgi:hypothetical protein